MLAAIKAAAAKSSFFIDCIPPLEFVTITRLSIGNGC
jgi:hypothetical protein